MIGMFKYLVRILEKKEQKILRKLIIMTLVSPITDLFNFSVIILIINTAMREQQASRSIVAFTFFMGIVSMLKGGFDLYKYRLHNQFIYSGAQNVSEKMCELLLKENLMQHNRKNPMQALTLVRNDPQVCLSIIVKCINIWIDILVMCGYFAVMIYTSKWVGLVSCVAFILLMTVVFFSYRNQIQTYGESSRMYAIKANAQVTIAHGNFKEIKIADNSEAVLQRYKRAGQKYAQIQQSYQYKKNIIGMFMKNLVMTAMFGILAFFLWRPGENIGTFLSSMLVYLTMLMKMVPIAYEIVSELNDVKFSQKSYGVLREELTNYQVIKHEEQCGNSDRKKCVTLKKGIRIQNLTFAYHDQMQIFQNASVEIPAGCSVAIIGVSGIGKTTFLDLILGLLMPQSGQIFYDDYDIVGQMDKEGPCLADLGSVTSYIPQTVYLNGETICNNVAFFANETAIDMKRVEECLKCAQVWEDVIRMPEGVHTLIGENGRTISGGQRQRIALARALYRDFELLVMDEATAALDLETEKAVIDSIRQVKGKKTIVLATHHMSLAYECDMVFSIENLGFKRVK